MPTKMHAGSWGAIAMAFAGGISAFAADLPPGKLPFRISPETTVITTPLNADGTPDYVAALNEKYGKGVTPENNGFALMLEVLGTREGDGILGKQAHDKTLAMLGIPENAADRAIHHYWGGYWSKQGLSDKEIDRLDDRLNVLARSLWSAADEPHVAEYLKAEGPMLDEVREAAARPRWWSPTAGGEDGSLEGMLPSLGPIKAMGEELAMRAMERLAEGNFDGFLADVQAIKRVGRRMTGGTTLVEVFVGYGTGAVGDEAIAAAADSGKLTPAQCAAILKMLDGLPEAQAAVLAVDREERWELLENAEQVAMGRAAKLFGGSRTATGWALPLVDPARVDWDAALRQLNGRFDEAMAEVQAADIAAVRAKVDASKREFQAHKPADMEHVDLSPRDGESKSDYTARVAWGIEAVAMPDFDSVRRMELRMQMNEGMVRMLIAAADVRAKTGKWPEKGEDLVPGEMKELPRDIYSDGGKGTEAVKYGMTPAGPRVYSVGENGRDDGGMRGDGGKDDIALGGFEAASEKAPDAEMP